MSDSQDNSSTFSGAELSSVVTTLQPTNAAPITSTIEEAQQTRPVASTLDAPAEACSPPLDTSLALSLRDVLFLSGLALLCLGLSVWHWGRLSGWGATPVEIERLPERVYDYRLDVNQATLVEWLQLPGIGETLAQRIIDYRAEHGPFESVNDLDHVKGIGPKTVEKLRPWLVVHPKDSTTSQGLPRE